MALASGWNADLQPVRRIDEAEAQRISNRIDDELRAEREALKRRKNAKRDVKVMLLGQAESGKSTLQKQFQLYYASQTMERERPAWRPVVHFNIVRAVRMILEELDHEFSSKSPIDGPGDVRSMPPSRSQTPVNGAPSPAPRDQLPPLPPIPSSIHTNGMSANARGKLPAIPGSGAQYTQGSRQTNGHRPHPLPPAPTSSPRPTVITDIANGRLPRSLPSPGPNIGGYGGRSDHGHGGFMSPMPPAPTPGPPITGGWTDDLSALRTKLLPLVAVEDALARDLSGGVAVTGAGGRTGVFVRAGWQSFSGRGWGMFGGGSNSNSNEANGNTNGQSKQQRDNSVSDLVARMLAASREEVAALWRHSSVRQLVKYRKVRLEESASYFLSHVQRIAEPDYLPDMEDILNVRLQTLGVKEHSFDISMSGTRVNWLLYDVGGARGQRHAWVPYFDDATAIIFLAPISAFDQYLEEDPRTNRIDDSLQLFTMICSNKLLKRTHLVLLLNKTDLLKQKLAAGIKVKKYITSFGNRPNTYEDVSEYFRAHFLQVHRRNDVSKRALYAHFTSMLDIKATQKIIVNVGEAIIRSYIADAGLT